ncbi:hypothetical protein K458DRAFT_486372 [Lentithecium fluviatile CBS 122367]|uniref:Cellulose-binding family II protein n=1 Tax=Lentithecium fluviatile CBS 122367 TaxID=1168545 RepID=A0A6G1J898_9PLEO|nr:hypothetical protein K458DRAFT_486372 [Lentithecium fluviatile CBS 122367]
MKYAFALSALAASAYPAAVPIDASPICKFNTRALTGDIATPISKRDLNQTTWNPPSNLIAGLKEVWDHTVSTRPNDLNFKNYGYDQVMAGKGKIGYCVRWESSQKLTAAQRAKTQAKLSEQYNKWIAALAGFEKFPYKTVEVKVVGWAVKNKGLLEGDVSGINVYTDLDSGGAPQCSEGCGRFFHQDGDYSKCAAGAAAHYDNSLWLTEGFGGGAGGDWGQRIGSEYFMQNIDAANIHILLHEMGHTFALDDFYDWTPSTGGAFIMNAGGAMQITEFDAWMARDWWRNIKSRYGL